MTAKLKQLEELEVIEKVTVPTNWINPLVARRREAQLNSHLFGNETGESCNPQGETPSSHSGRNITGDFRGKSFRETRPKHGVLSNRVTRVT